MPVFANVRIKPGSQCFQDRRGYTWPPSQYEDGFKLAGVPDDQVFVAKKSVSSEGNVEWDCKAEGAGMPGYYGNGGITVIGNDLEFLTPMLSYDPSKEERGINEW